MYFFAAFMLIKSKHSFAASIAPEEGGDCMRDHAKLRKRAISPTFTFPNESSLNIYISKSKPSSRILLQQHAETGIEHAREAALWQPGPSYTRICSAFSNGK
jgi:hypothetical protein